MVAVKDEARKYSAVGARFLGGFEDLRDDSFWCWFDLVADRLDDGTVLLDEAARDRLA